MKNQSSAPLAPARQSELAYARILEALFAGKVSFGSFISQADLTAMTGIGVGPVRDALKLLEMDGIIVIHPRSGIEVIRPSTELARSTYQFRSIIERFAVRQFTLTASPAVVDQLIAQHESAISDLDGVPLDMNLADEMTDLEECFHLPIVASLANAIVDAAYGRLGLLSRIVKMNGLVTRHTAAISIGEHLDALRAARARDPDSAEAAMVRHLANALQRNLGLA